MPCVRLSPHRFHHGPRHHPFWMGDHSCHGGAVMRVLLSRQMQDSHKADFDEMEDSFIVRMDVPGVKAHHVTIEEKDGEVEVAAIRMENDEVAKTYQDVMYIDPYKADFENAQALLKEGVLTIKFPKKINVNSIELQAVASQPPAVQSSDEEFRITTDLPGVKAADLKMKIAHDTLWLCGKRSMGQQNFATRHAFDIPRGVDMSNARAFLMDGVFTLVAPKMELKSSNLRIISVNEDISMEDLRIDDAAELLKETKDDDMVETVAEEKDWERVDETNPPSEK